MSSESVLRKIYHWKVHLLLSGLRITEKFIRKVKNYTNDFSKGRRGGAGPAGGRYFRFENGSIANVALWGPQSEESYLFLEDIVDDQTNSTSELKCRIRNSIDDEKITLDLIPIPEEYNEGPNIDGIRNKEVALVHGTSCLASTLVQKCRYWGDQTACAFCGIEFSLHDNSTIEKKTPEQLLLSIESALPKGLCSHMTLTMGTLSTSDKGAEKYIEIVSKIKKNHPDLPIHIQIEPFNEVSKLSRLKDAGVDTIGIHLEIPDDSLRKKYCSGKFSTSRDTYELFWKRAVEIFGRGQVSTFILLGFGENSQDIIEYVDFLIELGVVPNIMPVRYIMGTNLDYKPIKYEDLIEILNSTAQSFIKHNLNPHLNKAGCVICAGCSPIIDAYDFFKSFTTKQI
jgi:radical SAM protein (TIGR04043 family)